MPGAELSGVVSLRTLADARILRKCTALLALGSAYISYRHGRTFALRFGADETTALLWPLIVDGLPTMSTIELWKTSQHPGITGGLWKAWLSFTLGIALSLCANIASAPEPSTFAIAVAACPPIALLLSVELLNQALKRHHTTPEPEKDDSTASAEDGVPEGGPGIPPPGADQAPAPRTARNATTGHHASSHDESLAHREDSETEDPLRQEAYRLDARHWNLHHRPISADTLRRQLGIGSHRARTLSRHIRQHHQPQSTHRAAMASTKAQSC